MGTGGCYKHSLNVKIKLRTQINANSALKLNLRNKKKDKIIQLRTKQTLVRAKLSKCGIICLKKYVFLFVLSLLLDAL